MKSILKIIITISLFQSTVIGQTSTNDKSIIGKWSTCYGSKFDKNYKCDSNLKYEFFENGNYLENRNPVCNSQQYIGVTGKWTLKSNKLIMNEDAYCTGLKSRKDTKKIKWINEDVFYHKGREGKNGPIVYIYL